MKLRYIEGYDTQRIVTWRNANADFFPSQEPWTAESHLRWYARYLTDMSDFVHMVCLDDGTPVGTIGITRIDENHYEIGRVMLGERELAPQGIMSRALQEVMKLHEADYYQLKVLCGNAHAIGFYLKNGFWPSGEDDDFLYMIRSSNDPAVQA